LGEARETTKDISVGYNKRASIMKPTKLELTWIGKENRPKVEPRILVEDAAKSHHAAFRVGDKDIYDNRIILGDNLLALKALEQEFAGQVKCIYIDPPYNTGNAFEQYDDGIEHSLWLSLMSSRLELFHKLLSKDGSIWISIDDDECHYLKVLCDEIFERKNFIANVVWQKKYGPANDAKWLSDSHDHILVYSKNRETWRPYLVPRSEEQLQDYKNPDNDPRGLWRASDLSAKTPSESCIYPIIGPSGLKFMPPPTRSWIVSKTRYEELLRDNRIWFGTKGTGRPMVKKFLTEVKDGITAETWWPRDFADDNKIAKYESKDLFTGESFATPKPEKLLLRILQIATKPGDLVLDSFAGSGTTGAVAHKMGRRWIMVELGEHCHTHIIPRMKKVIDGEDKGGITEAAGWKGGGGFRYYRLAPSLLEKDQFGNWVISKQYNASMLAEAMCKLEGFTFDPSDTWYWQQGHSTERDYIYVTTQMFTREQLQKLSDEVGENRSLLVMCGAFRAKNLEDFPNLTVKKIPKAVLTRCEWSRDDYSLEIKNLPLKPDEPGKPQDAAPRSKQQRRLAVEQPFLFEEE